MKPTERLVEEHGWIKRMLRVLGIVCDRLEAGAAPDTEHLEQTLRFIKDYADRCHHGKEEDLLFPSLVEAGMSRENGPIAVMLYEHGLGRGYARAMGEALLDMKKGSPDATREFVAQSRNYIVLLSQHIFKEDSILFPMADSSLSAGKQESLSAAFTKTETERLGPGGYDEYQKLVERLESAYGASVPADS